MAKSKRKKNYKLRRRVMRTVAALTMIMAVGGDTGGESGICSGG